MKMPSNGWHQPMFQQPVLGSNLQSHYMTCSSHLWGYWDITGLQGFQIWSAHQCQEARIISIFQDECHKTWTLVLLCTLIVTFSLENTWIIIKGLLHSLRVVSCGLSLLWTNQPSYRCLLPVLLGVALHIIGCYILRLFSFLIVYERISWVLK